jgi:hypothetical protein
MRAPKFLVDREGRPHRPVTDGGIAMRKPTTYRRHIGPFAVMVAVLLAVVGVGVPAEAANVVNATIHVPADVWINPCHPADVVNLNGDIHVVITATADHNGGYHVVNHLNSHLRGASITTGTRYLSNENNSDVWNARSPYPAIHTHTYDFRLISQSRTDNYVLHVTTHETVNAGGVATVTVDDSQMDCLG